MGLFSGLLVADDIPVDGSSTDVLEFVSAGWGVSLSDPADALELTCVPLS
jgi:hypothetical protein